MDIVVNFWTVLVSMLRDVLPIAIILFVFQVLVLRRPIKNPARIAIGMIFVLVGLTLFLEGLQMALFPLGRLMAEQLTAPEFINIQQSLPTATIHLLDYRWVLVFALAIVFATTMAEPALLAVAIKARQISGRTISIRGLRLAVATGASLGVALGVVRIITGTPLHWFIIGGYLVVIAQTALAPKFIVSLAYDSGGVTTSTVTVPVVAALGLGLAETIPGRSPLIDGFGLIAFAALFPIMSVMGYAMFVNWRSRSSKSGNRQENRKRGIT